MAKRNTTIRRTMIHKTLYRILKDLATRTSQKIVIRESCSTCGDIRVTPEIINEREKADGKISVVICDRYSFHTRCLMYIKRHWNESLLLKKIIKYYSLVSIYCIYKHKTFPLKKSLAQQQWIPTYMDSFIVNISSKNICWYVPRLQYNKSVLAYIPHSTL